MLSRDDRLGGKDEKYYPTDEQLSAFTEMYDRWRPGIEIQGSVDKERETWRLEVNDGGDTKVLRVSLKTLEHASGAELVREHEHRFRGFFSVPGPVKKDLYHVGDLGPMWRDRSDSEI